MRSKQKEAAKQIAEIMYASLQQFPEEEQQRRIREIEGIPVKSAKLPGKSPKPSSTRARRPSRRRAGAAR